MRVDANYARPSDPIPMGMDFGYPAIPMEMDLTEHSGSTEKEDMSAPSLLRKEDDEGYKSDQEDNDMGRNGKSFSVLSNDGSKEREVRLNPQSKGGKLIDES